MFDYTSIKYGDKLETTNRTNGLYSYEIYTESFSQALLTTSGWNKGTENNLGTLSYWKGLTSFKLPKIENDLHLPHLMDTNEKIKNLEPGVVVVVHQIMYQTGKASSTNTSLAGLAFQCLLVSTVEDTPVIGLLWTVHRSELFVKPYVEEQKEEETPPSDEEKKEEVPPTPDSGKEIHVNAGQTLVLDVKSTKEGEGKESENLAFVEIDVLNAKSKLEGTEIPYTKDTNKNYKVPVEVIHLIGNGKIYAVEIDPQTGKGLAKDVVPGKYRLALRIGSIYFDTKKSSVSAKDNNIVDLAKLISTSDTNFKKLKVIGFTDNVGGEGFANNNLSLSRAVEVKKIIKSMQSRIKDILILNISCLPGDGNDVRKQNRRADIFGVMR